MLLMFLQGMSEVRDRSCVLSGGLVRLEGLTNWWSTYVVECVRVCLGLILHEVARDRLEPVLLTGVAHDVFAEVCASSSKPVDQQYSE